ncbi:MAG: hypothetical protein KME06_02345 [Kastovskya adunca ATA6-11-RM4]|jgi:hypothetical protein|nr:hypothetical protein [Kastovskya adunca ATA6-11-RM4]
MAKVLDKRWRTVLELQQRLQMLTPGSSEAEIIEYAISLAINSQSQEQNLKFFRYDLIRNARFCLGRAKVRQTRLWQKAASFTPTWTEDAEPCVALEIEEQLRAVVYASGKNLSQCFHDLLNGRSLADTASACGISQRTANRLRQKVRQIVQTYLETQDIA